MTNRANQQYRVSVGSTFPVAVLLTNYRTMLPFVQADVHSITEVITDSVTKEVQQRTLTKTQVVFDTLQSSAEIGEAGYEYNVLVIVPSDRIVARRTYRYQLVIVPDNGAGSADAGWTQKSDEIDLIGD